MKKLLLTLGTTTATVAPLATVIACGTSTNETFAIDAVVVSDGYSGTLNSVAAGTNDFAGAWSDARFYIEENAEKVQAVGVEKYRIANDGIQARGDMNAHDMAAIQDLFVYLIAQAQTDDGLKIDLGEKNEDGTVKLESLFDIYSHSAYTKITDANQEVAYIDNDKATTTKMLQTAPMLDATGGELFTPATDSGDPELKDGQTLDITFIPSNNPADAQLASSTLETYLNLVFGADKFNINVSADYNAAALALENGTIDVAFLPVNTWATHANKTNFILQAGRPLQVATLGFDGTDVSLPGATITNQAVSTLALNEFSQLYLEDVKTGALEADNTNLTKFNEIIADHDHVLHEFAEAARAKADSITDDAQFIAGSYESFIFGNTDNKLTNDILALYTDLDGNDWTMDGKEVLADVKYAATSNTSGASYVFPQLWFNRHFDVAFKA